MSDELIEKPKTDWHLRVDYPAGSYTTTDGLTEGQALEQYYVAMESFKALGYKVLEIEFSVRQNDNSNPEDIRTWRTVGVKTKFENDLSVQRYIYLPLLA